MAVEPRPFVQAAGFERDVTGLPAASAREVCGELMIEHHYRQVIDRHERFHGAQQGVREIRLAERQDRSPERGVVQIPVIPHRRPLAPCHLARCHPVRQRR